MDDNSYIPEFSKLVFERPASARNIDAYDLSTGSFSLYINWTKNTKARSCLITAPDKSIWKITASQVEQTQPETDKEKVSELQEHGTAAES